MNTSSLIYVCVIMVTLWTTSQVLTQAPSYNAAQLSKCALMSQQLRNGIWNRTNTVALRAAAITNLTTQKMQAVNADLNSASLVWTQTWNALYQAALAIRKQYGLALKMLRDVNYVPTMPVWSVVEFDHGLGYNAATTSLRFRKAGIYLIEFKAQSQYYRYSYTTIRIFTSAGTVKYNYYLYTDWEVSPFILLASILVGDYMVIYPNPFSILNGVNSTFAITLLQG